MKEGYTKLHPIKFALSLASIVALMIFLTTIAALTNSFGGFSFIFSIIYDVYGKIGYAPTLLGSVLGAIYSFIDTFILAWLFTWLYNKLIG